ncbi:MAG: purine-nucleoside phosphorylase [Chitinophagaceae bacterium]|nr:purine-nucleoside phosphorylase [Chitinophagaceae bacterium]
MDLFQKLTEATEFLKKRRTNSAKIGVVLGSGLGNFEKEMIVETEVGYDSIPHFPVATVAGHDGKWIFGVIAGKQVLAMSGRIHYYEGYTAEEVVFPIRVMKLMGVGTLLISNAAGGVNTSFRVGDLMIITDHIALASVNPLIGKNDNRVGPRFPDMSEPYKKDLIIKAKQIAQRHNIDVKEGVYFGVTGPAFETRAEYKMIRTLGADAVGMSTVQEVIAANHAGMDVFAMSVITDIGIREEDNKITHEDVLREAQNSEPNLSFLFRELIASID